MDRNRWLEQELVAYKGTDGLLGLTGRFNIEISGHIGAGIGGRYHKNTQPILSRSLSVHRRIRTHGKPGRAIVGTTGPLYGSAHHAPLRR